ncbi:nucleic acid-binding protein [Halomicrococcus sp. SG-WS-1]|uniref:nucleic acid-binding protein n=1 Tax=Halomicrococcus sp. SG-WS-1 TaxID=3439057 RepID=UPI003F7B0ED2
MTTAAVADTGPLIHLAEIDALDLLTTLDRLLVPETVYAELQAGGLPDRLSELDFERITVDEPIDQTPELDAGERAALAVADNQEDLVLLTDDLAAREFAQQSDIEVHGSIGIIALGYHRGMLTLDEAATHMRALQAEASLFITDAVVEQGIELLESEDDAV